MEPHLHLADMEELKNNNNKEALHARSLQTARLLISLKFLKSDYGTLYEAFHSHRYYPDPILHPRRVFNA